MRGEVETPLLPLQIVAESFRTGTITVPLSATGFETLRQVLFGLIRAMSNTPSITAIYVALDSDGTFLGYYNKGITIGHGEENFTMTLLNGQTCAWDYGADCDADDPTAPCLQGLDQQPDCRRYYDISQTTGVPWCSPPGSTPAPNDLAGWTNQSCWFDEYYKSKAYDPRVRAWYPAVMAFAASDVFYSDVYIFSTSKLTGVSLQQRLYSVDEEIVGAVQIGFSLEKVSQILEATCFDEATATALVTVACFLVDDHNLVIGSSMAGTAINDDGSAVYAPESNSTLIRGAVTHAATIGYETQSIVTVEGVEYYMDLGVFQDLEHGMDWNVTTLTRIECAYGYGVNRVTLECEECKSPLTSSSASIDCDECLPGFYSMNKDPTFRDALRDATTFALLAQGPSCHACPDGGECPGGTHAPMPQSGYFGDAKLRYLPVQFYKCRDGECDGDYTCHSGLQGILCETIAGDQTHYGIADRSFLNRCPKSTPIMVLTLLSLFSLVIVVWYFLNFNYSSASLAIFLNVSQVLAIYSSNDIAWPRVSRGLNVFLNITLFDVDVVTFDCFFVHSSITSYYLQLAITACCFCAYLPLLTNVAVARLGGRVRTLSVDDVQHESDTAFALVLSIVSVTYAAVTQKSFEALACVGFHGIGMRSKLDLQVSCGSRKHTATACVAAFAVAIIVFGVPHCLALALFREKRQRAGLNCSTFLKRYQSVYADYRLGCYNWNLVQAYKIIAYCAVATFVNSPRMNLVLAASTTTASLVLHGAYAPLKEWHANNLELLGNIYTFVFIVSSGVLDEKRTHDHWSLVVVVLGFGGFAATALLYVYNEEQRRAKKALAVKLIKATLTCKPRRRSSRTLLLSLLPSSSSQNLAKGVARSKTSRDPDDDDGRPDLEEPKTVHTPPDEKDGLPDDGDDDEPCSRSLDAIDDIADTFTPDDLLAWVRDPRRVSGDYEKLLAFANDINPYIVDSSPTSVFSGCARARFWRHIEGLNKFILTFAVSELSQHERVLFFGCLARMQQFSPDAASDTFPTPLKFLIEPEDRSSVLYYYFSAPDQASVQTRALLMQISSSSAANRPARSLKSSNVIKTDLDSGGDDDTIHRRENLAIGRALRATIAQTPEHHHHHAPTWPPDDEVNSDADNDDQHACDDPVSPGQDNPPPSGCECVLDLFF